jgi:iron complex outermembrane receptor protein
MKFFAALLAALAVSLPLAAQQKGSEEKELSELLSIMQQETDVATKTRLNSDYVPGIVTVLQGDDLEALGIATAGEALGLVPGMQAVLDDRGAPAVIVRGIDFPFNSGNIQILINSIPLTRPDAGVNASALLMPVEQIERIEVIRGPGSVIYGDFAFMGLVNIITRQEGKRVYGRLNARDDEGGARYAGSLRGAAYSANVSRLNSDNAVAPSLFHHAHEGRWFGIGTVKRGGFALTGQFAQRTFDPTTGGGPALLRFHENSWVVDGRYGHDFTSTLHGEVFVSRSRNDISDSISIFKGGLTKLGVSAVWSGLPRQSWLAGADYSISSIDSAAHAVPPPPGQQPGAPQPLVANADRRITGFLLQDRLDLHAVSVTLGGRLDSYSDLHTRLTPRASVVWRVSDRHILKAQYAEGFRPPTFFELYTPPQPRIVPRYPFEVNATSELNYVYRSAGIVGRATLFHSDIRDMIRPGGVVVAGKAKANGAELEVERQLTSHWKFDANASHVKTVDPRFGGTSDAAAASWLGNLGLFYRPFENTIIGARWNHVSGRTAYRGYDTAGFTLSRQNLFFPGFSARAGVGNAFNDSVTYLNTRPTGEVSVSPFPGRSAWFQLSWRG